MVDTLHLDTAGLRGAARTLVVISAELSMGDSYADRVGGSVGHAGLAARLRSFTDGWRVRREEIDAQVMALATILTTTADAFESVDRDLAGAARSGAERPAAAGRGGGAGW